MSGEGLISGTELLDRVDEFLRENKDLVSQIKVSVAVGDRMRVIALRCRGIEALADFLADRVKVAVLSHQHDVVLVAGNVVLLGGNVSWLKKHNTKGREIDIMTWRTTIEVKNGVNISTRDVDALVTEYFDEMVASKASKRTWWLCYFLKRPRPKGKICDACMYYLVIVEIPVAALDASEACRVAINGEAVRLSEELEKKVVIEDSIEDGFLVPVKNVWIVDKLRLENEQLKKENAESEKALAEKNDALSKERARREALERENAALKRRLGT